MLGCAWRPGTNRSFGFMGSQRPLSTSLSTSFWARRCTTSRFLHCKAKDSSEWSQIGPLFWTLSTSCAKKLASWLSEMAWHWLMHYTKWFTIQNSRRLTSPLLLRYVHPCRIMQMASSRTSSSDSTARAVASFNLRKEKGKVPRARAKRFARSWWACSWHGGLPTTGSCVLVTILATALASATRSSPVPGQGLLRRPPGDQTQRSVGIVTWGAASSSQRKWCVCYRPSASCTGQGPLLVCWEATTVGCQHFLEEVTSCWKDSTAVAWIWHRAFRESWFAKQRAMGTDLWEVTGGRMVFDRQSSMQYLFTCTISMEAISRPKAFEKSHLVEGVSLAFNC